jgi:hypothetical protein
VHKNEKMKRKRATPLCIFEPERVAASSLMMVMQPSTSETDSHLARFVLRTHALVSFAVAITMETRLIKMNEEKSQKRSFLNYYKPTRFPRPPFQ